MGRIEGSHHVIVRVGFHPDNFSCVPLERTRRALSRLTEVDNTIIGSTIGDGMTLERATELALKETNRDGYTTEAHGSTIFVSRGVVRPNREL